ncbi:MAG: co-chaperone GroES [Actinomycetota bacterium]
MGLKPLGDRVLIKIEESENALPSGLVIPDTAKEKPQEGTVVAVGPGSYQDGTRVPLDVKEGDRVLFSKYGGTEVKVGGDEFMMLNERDVLAIVT